MVVRIQIIKISGKITKTMIWWKFIDLSVYIIKKSWTQYSKPNIKEKKEKETEKE